MDPAHFDILVGRLASRRRLLASLAAGAVGIAGPTAAAARHRHRHHHRCPSSREVCGAVCCPIGQGCSGGACGTAPSCVGNPPLCSIGADCCSGTCNVNRFCRCSAAGQPCFVGDADCCNGLHCIGFTCQTG
jgi:hypothetical protein